MCVYLSSSRSHKDGRGKEVGRRYKRKLFLRFPSRLPSCRQTKCVCVCTCVCFQLIHTNKTSASSYTQQTLPPPASQTEPCCLQQKRQETGRSVCALQNKSALTGVWPGEVVWLKYMFLFEYESRADSKKCWFKPFTFGSTKEKYYRVLK